MTVFETARLLVDSRGKRLSRVVRDSSRDSRTATRPAFELSGNVVERPADELARYTEVGGYVREGLSANAMSHFRQDPARLPLFVHSTGNGEGRIPPALGRP